MFNFKKNSEPVENKVNSDLVSLQLSIDGMHCTSCALNIDFDLEALPGVHSARTNYASGITEVCFDVTQVSKSQIVAIIEQSGYSIKE